MRFALCNEVLGTLEFGDQCRYARLLGYDALEVAPFTLAEDPSALTDAQLAGVRALADDEGIAIAGLHWLLVKPDGFSISSTDDAVRRRTVEFMQRLIGMCARLGGSYLVHGSPGQRNVAHGESREAALGRAKECWAAAGEAATAAGLVYCIEPLSKEQTPLVNTLAEAVAIVDELNIPGLKTMLDTSSAARSESNPISSLIDRWLPTGHIRHVQLNDSNRMGPGQGKDRFAPVLAALKRNRYHGVVAMEPFKYEPDGPGSAARAIGYVKGILEALEQ